MPVTPKAPIVVPEKTADKYWMSEITIKAPVVNGEARAEITLIPYVSSNGDRVLGNNKRIIIENILSKIVGGDTTLAQAFDAIQLAVQAEIDAEE